MAESVGAFLLGGIFIGATVGAALKKVAVSILTNPKVIKKVGIVVGSILLVILMPVIAIVSVAMCSMYLLHHLSRIIQNKIEQNRRRRNIKTDRKTRQKTDDKKFGLGLH